MKETDTNDVGAQLSAKEVTLTFTKANGETRVMTATRNLSLIPTEDHPKGTGECGPTNIIRVYDTENQGWRSFNIDSLISYEEVA